MSFSVGQGCPATKARVGVLRTPHGEIATPAFMPVGTRGSVKAVSPAELRELGAQIILGNTYHLFLRPGIEIVRRAGGLHAFCGWDRPMLTDSGGYQVFSLAPLRKVKPDGVEFASHIDGTRFFLGPVEAMGIQRELGADIVMAFDECTPYPCSRPDAERSLELTHRWARISRDQRLAPGQQLFGIVQGSTYRELRERSARELVGIGFDGYALGGLSVGESEEEMFACVDWTVPLLPADRPRYLMGVGTPRQLIAAVARGVDLFDCVLPTRLARHGSAFLRNGETIPVKAARYAEDFGPIEPGCACPCCTCFTRAYVRHLLNVGEILGLRLLTLHNLHCYLTLMREMREAIVAGTFREFAAERNVTI